MLAEFKRILLKNSIYIKYLFAGGIATFVDLGLIFIFTDLFNIWYLASATLSYSVSFFVSFGLQKFWTFSDNSKRRVYNQLSLYLALNLFNILLNAALMYVLVDLTHVWYVYAKIITSGLIAIWSFLIYKTVIFKLDKNEPAIE